MNKNVTNRQAIIDFLKQEIVGGMPPSPSAIPIPQSHPLTFDSPDDLKHNYFQEETGQEILQREHPESRFGVGVLYPVEARAKPPSSDGNESPPIMDTEEDEPIEVMENTPQPEHKDFGQQDAETDDFEITAEKTVKLSSMGVSFLLGLTSHAFAITIEISGAEYVLREAKGGGRTEGWWFRHPLSFHAQLTLPNLSSDTEIYHPALESLDDTTLNLSLSVVVRPHSDGREALVTVTLVNRTLPALNHKMSHALFQSALRIDVGDANHILPYPTPAPGPVNAEDESMDLLYRRYRTYAIGHGCAANWKEGAKGHITSIFGEHFPVVSVPNMTSDILDETGKPLRISMTELAGIQSEIDGMASLHRVCDLYAQWIEARKQEIAKLPTMYHNTATANIQQCTSVLSRMREGIAFLEHNAAARKAFQFSNHAILLQQIRTQEGTRNISYDRKNNHWRFSRPFTKISTDFLPQGRGLWRGFQIAFLLSTIKSTVVHNDPDRNSVELLWFPTGGGKTEAYLGLAAFYMAYQRLTSAHSDGANIIMRYTLRLLTTQQFQRASGLICAMEYLRLTSNPELGPERFTIGLWLGGTTTPNRNSDAQEALKKLIKQRNAPNPFVLQQCPWCGAQMGPAKDAKLPKGLSSVMGYESKGKTVILKCPDRACTFSSGLPVMLIDEQLYETPPSIVIGTVDKFAMLAWRPEAKSLFGLGPEGQRRKDPPGLIIQDELHLISGPLGSMVGLYEPVLESLCTYMTEAGNQVLPKIVTSTATIRRYQQQIKNLYGRESVKLFPPPGIDIGDSFFSREATFPDGTLMPGKMFAGIFAPGLSSMQTAQVRTFAALMQAPMDFSTSERDPWWTQLIFFNSLRELGTTLSLFQSDIPDRLKILRKQLNIPWSLVRRQPEIIELTSRIGNSEIPATISLLEKATDDPNAKSVDVCLASNIIEVGIDIDRLSLMGVVGQPKSTSQYIQVTGRVGRRWEERPGLVVTLLSASKPRDRSHFEQFRSYHQRLYAQVEPTSLTPFSPPALERGLHGAMLAYVRQVANLPSPYPLPKSALSDFSKILLARVLAVDPSELSNAQHEIARRERQWSKWQPSIWSAISSSQDAPLMRAPGEYVPPNEPSWVTPQSMRNVDAQCAGDIRRPLSLIQDEGDQ